MYNIPELTRQTTPWRAYETSFTYYSKAWNSHNWIRTPFGVCYAVWARVGSDLESTILGNGWVRTLNEGIVGSVDITLPATGPTPTGGQGHYSTVYIPIIKGIETFSDALDYILVGATAVAIGSANLTKHDISIKIAQGFEKYFEDQMQSI